MPDDLVNLTVDGVPVSVPKGTLVIEAAKLAGVLIPHYCYHPSLPVAGVCRMCLVDIEKVPKLAASCATPVAAGMVVLVDSAAAKAAGQEVLEVLLINHPVDCLIFYQAWAGNVVDLCPVGALISKDFLHKARAWDLDKTASVCPGCTQGCNIMLDTRDNQVIRVRPRPNMDVNRHFICDVGRLEYKWLNRADRLEVPMVREGERLVPVDWDRALAKVAEVAK